MNDTVVHGIPSARKILKKGDIIFTGTPEGVAAVKPNDILEGYLEDKKSFRIQVK